LFAIFDPPFPNYRGGPFLWGKTKAVYFLPLPGERGGVRG